jgi:hypothetical protein
MGKWTAIEDNGPGPVPVVFPTTGLVHDRDINVGRTARSQIAVPEVGKPEASSVGGFIERIDSA